MRPPETHGSIHPELSGVARSYNYYPMGRAKPEEGVASLALGLGKTIVDGLNCLLGHPASARPFHPVGHGTDAGMGKLMDAGCTADGVGKFCVSINNPDPVTIGGSTWVAATRASGLTISTAASEFSGAVALTGVEFGTAGG